MLAARSAWGQEPAVAPGADGSDPQRIPAEAEGDAPPETDGLSYRLTLRVEPPTAGAAEGDGADDTAPQARATALADRLRPLTRLESLKQRPPLTRLGLERRMTADLDRLERALRAEGYYAGRVSGRIENGGPAASSSASSSASAAEPVSVVISVVPGPLYRLSVVEVLYQGGHETRGLPTGAAAAGLTLGAPARAEAVLAGERRLVESLGEAARPMAQAADRRVVVDHTDRTMEVAYRIDPGPPAAFGALQITGLDAVAARHVRDMVPWRQGDPYDAREVRRFRARLTESRLFKTISLKPGDAVDAHGRVPVHLTVTEGPPRTIALGATYATDRGPGVTLRWEHRNIFGAGEKLRVDAVGALSEQSVEATLRKPYFLGADQALTLGARAAREDLDAYRGLVGEASIGLDRTWGPDLRTAIGIATEYASLTWLGDAGSDGGDGETQGHLLVGLPMEIQWDGSDNLLDPTQGARASLTAAPYAGMVDDSGIGFLRLDARASVYQSLGTERIVAAARVRLASLMGAALDRLPPNHRLYAGGGGSVRGFGHQMIGPLDAGGDPLGGRSAAEIGAELRAKVTETIALVPFVEGGLVGPDPWPSLAEDIRWGGGLGLRYHTDFGPLRADFAVPFNPRQDDDWFQVYVSLGQAF